MEHVDATMRFERDTGWGSNSIPHDGWDETQDNVSVHAQRKTAADSTAADGGAAPQYNEHAHVAWHAHAMRGDVVEAAPPSHPCRATEIASS